MAFEGLTQKLQGVFRNLGRQGKVTEAQVREGMREVQLALLDADVNYRVVKDFIARVTEQACGAEVLRSLTPGQQIIKIVNDELTATLGGAHAKLLTSPQLPTVILLCGLQGAGKTTLAGKLALHLKKQGKTPMIAACDVYRPAAIEQLKLVAAQAEVPVWEEGQGDPVAIAKRALAEAKRLLKDTLIVDTAGRLHVDETLMDEVEAIKAAVGPYEILFCVDAMTGQDAVNAAKAFDERLDITGVVLTKLDGDARGGAALSVRAVTGKPIKFASVGEKLQDLEAFHPDRMASRILGMGDMLTLIEQAETVYNEKEAADLERKMRRAEFTLEDFLTQMAQVKKMGGLGKLLGMMPGMSGISQADIDEKMMGRTEAMILSMTREERENPNILGHSRKQRIIRGSGTTIQELNKLLKQFEQMKQMMKQMGKNPRGFGRGKMPF